MSQRFSSRESFGHIFSACSTFWLVVHGMHLIVRESSIASIPLSITIAFTVSIFLYLTKLKSPPVEFVDELLKQDANILRPTRNQGSHEYTFQDFSDAVVQGIVNRLFMANGDPRLKALRKAALEFLQRPSGATKHGLTNTFKLTRATGKSSGHRKNSPGKGPQILDMPLYVPVVGRRCAGTDAPENTLSAVEVLKKNGCRHVHFDVVLTKDLDPVVFHDYDLIRIAGVNEKLADLTYEELQLIDVSLGYKKFRGERVPKLESVIRKCLQLKLKFFVHLQDSSKPMTDAILNSYKAFPQMHSHAAIISDSWKAIYRIRRQDPSIIACLATESVDRHIFDVSSGPGFLSTSRQPRSPRHSLSSRRESRSLSSSLRNLAESATICRTFISDWMVDNIVWWYTGVSVVLITSSRVSPSLVEKWNQKGVEVLLWNVSNKMEKLYACTILNVGYFTDSVREDPVLHPDKLLVADHHRLSHYLFTAVLQEKDDEQSTNPKTRPQVPNTMPPSLQRHDESGSEEQIMYSLPPSPKASQYFSA